MLDLILQHSIINRFYWSIAFYKKSRRCYDDNQDDDYGYDHDDGYDDDHDDDIFIRLLPWKRFYKRLDS